MDAVWLAALGWTANCWDAVWLLYFLLDGGWLASDAPFAHVSFKLDAVWLAVVCWMLFGLLYFLLDGGWLASAAPFAHVSCKLDVFLACCSWLDAVWLLYFLLHGGWLASAAPFAHVSCTVLDQLCRVVGVSGTQQCALNCAKCINKDRDTFAVFSFVHDIVEGLGSGFQDKTSTIACVCMDVSCDPCTLQGFCLSLLICCSLVILQGFQLPLTLMCPVIRRPCRPSTFHCFLIAQLFHCRASSCR
jgi:hypothetical protein